MAIEPLSPFLAEAVPWSILPVVATRLLVFGLRGTIAERLGRKVREKGYGKTGG